MRPSGQPYAFKGSSQYAEEPLGRPGIRQLRRAIQEHLDETSIAMVFNPLGGVIKTPAYANAYPHRHCLYVIEVHSTFLKASHAEKERLHFTRVNNAIGSLFSGRHYVNYPDLNLENPMLGYYGQNFSRLIEIKKKYDPEHRFDFGPHSLSHWIKGNP